ELATTARFVEVAEQPVTPRVLGYGVVRPVRTWTATPQVAGRVEAVSPNFVKGGRVAAGEVLIRISDEDVRLAIAQAEANIASSDAQIEERRLAGENAEQLLETEQRSLELSELELARLQRLQERGAASQTAVDAQERTVLGQKRAVQQQEAELRLLPAQLKSLEQALAVEQSRLATAQLDLARTEIKAPFDGRVAEADVEATQYVGVGAALGVVDGAAKAEIEAQFAPQRMREFAKIVFPGGRDGEGAAEAAAAPTTLSDVAERVARARARRGLTATARLPFQGEAAEWPAEVSRLSDTVDPDTRAIGLIVTVDQPYGDPGRRPPLIKGSFVEVELKALPAAGLAVAPRAAVRGGEVMVVGADDRLERRAVSVIATIGDAALIAAGLAPGDRLIVSALSPAVEGMLLRPVRDETVEARLAAIAAGDGAAR
ncbi:MAG: HlyD family efflux transporter periplasmic adaptor subunit, partial [Pseudomonadota bacterium]